MVAFLETIFFVGAAAKNIGFHSSFLLSRQRRTSVFKKQSIPLFCISRILIESIPMLCKERVFGNACRIIQWRSLSGKWKWWTSLLCQEWSLSRMWRDTVVAGRPWGFHEVPPRGVPSWGVRNDAEQIFVHCYFVILFTSFEQNNKITLNKMTNWIIWWRDQIFVQHEFVILFEMTVQITKTNHHFC